MEKQTLVTPIFSFSISEKHAVKNTQPFNNKKWRMMIDQICHLLDPIDHSIHAISPFGFELTKDKKYLFGNLKRFYFYIGIKDKKFSEVDIAKKFADLFFEIMKNEDFFKIEDVVLRIEQNQFFKLKNDDYTCKYSDKLIDIQCRYVDTSIMDYYCDYVICCLSAINENKDEPKEFHTNKRFRVRTYQLYIMLEKLFGKYIDPMNHYENMLYSSIFSRVDNNINIFFDENELHEVSDSVDEILMNNLIKRRVSSMIDQLKLGGETISVVSKCLHVDDELKITINKKYYIDAVSKIKQTYWAYQ